MNGIDIVVLWVDGDDPKWLEERLKYEPEETSSANLASRFRDWGTLKYFFRGIEKNVDWYRYIFFITYGHVPKWLNLDNTKLKIVKHKDFIPKEYLPTYNSNVIELNLHRIEELSNDFILFNDDIFVIDKLKKTCFYKNGLPCDMLVAKNMVNYDLSSYVWHMAFNDMGIINRNFNGGISNVKHFGKWVNLNYGKNSILNFFKMLNKRYSAFYDFHIAVPHTKDTLSKIWDIEYEELNKTCLHKFRTPLDINHWVARYWRLATGEFKPVDVRKIGHYYEFYDNNLKEIKEAIIDKKYPIIVLNDTGCEQKEFFEKCKNEVIDSLEKVLPEKCLFEK